MIPTNKTISVLHPYANKQGGAVNMMIYLSNYLQEKNNHVIFHTFSYDKTLFLKYKICFKIKTFLDKGFGKMVSFFHIAFVIRKSDFIIVGNSPMHFVGVLSKVLFFSRAKIIWRNHHYPWYYSNNTKTTLLKRGIERYAVERIDLIISNSVYLQKEIKSLFHRDAKILYPVLAPEFSKLSLVEDRTSKSPVLCTYGRWVTGKNLQLISKTYESLKKVHPNLILIVGGYGEELEDFVTTWEHDRNVKIVGRLDFQMIIQNLQQSDVFLFPSLIDSFGLVILEAMSTGTPVVCMNKPGQDEIVQNGVNGYLVDSDLEFINRVHEILVNDSLKEQLSLSAVKTAQKFSLKTFETQLSHIFASF